MTGRTVNKHARVYVDGYDLSGDSRSIGALSIDTESVDLTTLTDGVKGVLPGSAIVSCGALNAVLDPTATTGIHAVISGSGVMRTVMIPHGFRAAPAQGDPVFMGQFEQKDYTHQDSYVNMQFEGSARATTLLYKNPWGWLLRPKTATTAVNTAVGIDDLLSGTSTAFGGYMTYMVFAGNGLATITCQEADTNLDGSFANITGATTGELDFSTVKFGIVPLGRTATIKRYLRWQISLNTATTVTFALAFHRAIH